MDYKTTQLTWEKLGFPSDRGARSPWHSGVGINRLLWSAGQRSDVCGLMVTGESFGWVGGYSYFHKDVNMYPGTGAAERSAANYLIALDSAAHPPEYSEVVERARGAVLLRRAGSCGPAPDGYQRELPY